MIAPEPSVTEDHDPIAEIEDLAQPMRDVEDTAALADQAPHRAEHVLDLDVTQRGGRLVEDQQLGISGDQSADLDELSLPDAQAPDTITRGDALETELPQDLAAPRSTARPAPDETGVAVPQEHVLLDSQLGYQRQLLVDDRDSGDLTVECALEASRNTPELQGTRVRSDEAGQDLDERALSRSVLAADADDFAGRDAE